jgi:sulfoxide reductase heme-binding subunit YedZ
VRLVKVVVFLASLVPAVWLVWAAFHDGLGANPIEYITRSTGTWTLRFLLIALAVTPLRKLLRAPGLIKYRRMLGLFAFFYGCLHLLTFVWLDKFFDVSEMLKDVVKRPFITAGFFGYMAMVPLAITSTQGWIRRLGGKRWQALHRLIYLSAAAGVVHYYWLVKSDIRAPVMYGTILAILLASRIAIRLWRPVKRPVAAAHR